MSRKDFELIASIIRSMPTHAASLRTARDSTARAFADGLRVSNPRFDSARFLRACGIES